MHLAITDSLNEHQQILLSYLFDNFNLPGLNLMLFLFKKE